MAIGTYLGISISAAVFAVIILIEAIFGADMFDKSQTFIPEIQEDASDFSKGAWNFYSAYILTVIIFAPILAAYLFIEQRSRCFYYLFVTFGVIAITNILKLIDHQARPFWIEGTEV